MLRPELAGFPKKLKATRWIEINCVIRGEIPNSTNISASIYIKNQQSICCVVPFRICVQLKLYLQIFNGNFDRNTPVKQRLCTGIVATRLRIIAQDHHGNCCMRVEIYGFPLRIGTWSFLSIDQLFYLSSSNRSLLEGILEEIFCGYWCTGNSVLHCRLITRTYIVSRNEIWLTIKMSKFIYIIASRAELSNSVYVSVLKISMEHADDVID